MADIIVRDDPLAKVSITPAKRSSDLDWAFAWLNVYIAGTNNTFTKVPDVEDSIPLCRSQIQRLRNACDTILRETHA